MVIPSGVQATEGLDQVVAEATWLRVPVGPEARRWATRAATARVLLVVHNVTSATRLLDVLPLFHGDLRIQCLATCTGSSPFTDGTRRLLDQVGLLVLPWEQAKATPADLVISASYGGELAELQGELAVLSHGIGYNKKLSREPGAGSREPGAGSREPGAGSREPGAGSREPGAGSREPGAGPVFGLSPEWLLHEGKPFASATVLSHPEQLERLRAACPEAAPTAVLAGDPCFDRMLAAVRYRERYRRAFGIAPGQRLVVLNSTWNPRALFGDAAGDPLAQLLPRLTSELPLDQYRTAAVLHPNIWHGHGTGQVRRWLERARRAGLLLIPPLGEWRQALIAADCVIGDHGSVTYYAAALGRPVLLGAFPAQDLDPGSPVAELGRSAPHLRPREPLRPQLDRLLDGYDPAPQARFAALATSAPGRSAALLRRLFYDLLGLAEPAHPAALDRLPLPDRAVPPPTAPVRVLTRLDRAMAGGAPEVAVTRYADPATEPGDPDTLDAHTVVHEETADPGRLDLADVVVAHDSRLGPAAAWTREALALYPHCAMAAFVTGPGRCLVRTADGRLVALTADPDDDGRPDLCDPAAYASALYAWYDAGGRAEELAHGLVVVTGVGRHRITVETDPPPEA
ncbi:MULTISPECIES: UDP-N-acetyl glucosamine 2-epimerase [Streptomycetaceae]|uniref:hypothetical protein n=1 Tax=Streptomycetaceae TaxID=2062 RepID=UPI000213E842|nr:MULTISPECIES: hypothetical protein [Streptomycetaceae]MYS59661.1 hypothetical protein [Streptomyces sp. SID5468]CCB75415.1 conserved protein of unknown function [Streptantibioticus cattleyicolor NRRL 8057 = DSM 46488]